MPLPPIAVEIAPAEADPALEQVLLAACTRAAQDARCVGKGAAEDAVATATVTWDTAPRVSLRVSLTTEQRAVVREITFDEGDALEERWRAAGLVIGTLASLLRRGEVDPADLAPAEGSLPDVPEPAKPASPPATVEPPPPEEPLPPPPPPAPPPRERLLDGWVEGGALLGSALDSGPPRVGAAIDGRVRVTGRWLFASVGVAYSESAGRVDRVRSRWAEGVLGIAVRHDLGNRFFAVGRAEALFQRLGAAVPEATSNAPDSGDRWLGGARVSAGAQYWLAPPLGVFVDASTQWVAGTTDVSVQGEKIVGTAPAFGVVARVGAAVEF